MTDLGVFFFFKLCVCWLVAFCFVQFVCCCSVVRRLVMGFWGGGYRGVFLLLLNLCWLVIFKCFGSPYTNQIIIIIVCYFYVYN